MPASPTFRVSAGILEAKHVHHIGEAIWVFLWCINRQTGAHGKILGGKPVSLREIAAEVGLHRNTISRHLTRLRNNGYVDYHRTPSGLAIRLLKNHKFRGKPVTTDGDCKQREGVTTGGESPAVVNHQGWCHASPGVVTRVTSGGDSNIRHEGTPEGTPEGSSRSAGERTAPWHDLVGWLMETWKTAEGETKNPTWGAADFRGLKTARKRLGDPEIKDRWRRFLLETYEGYAGHTLGQFTRNLDRWKKPKRGKLSVDSLGEGLRLRAKQLGTSPKELRDRFVGAREEDILAELRRGGIEVAK